LSTAGALQQPPCQDPRNPAESRGVGRGECQAPAQAIIPGQLGWDTAGVSMISASISGWKRREEDPKPGGEHDLSQHQWVETPWGGPQTRVSNFSSTHMSFEDHGSLWVF